MAVRCDVQARVHCSDQHSNQKSEHLCLVISPNRDTSHQSFYQPSQTHHSRRRSRSAESYRDSNPVSAMREAPDFQTQGQNQYPPNQYSQHQAQYQQQPPRQLFQGPGNGPGPAQRVPFNQTNLSLQQLQEMAYRQQQQIETQQQLLVAKEQRLKYLRQQDLSHHQLAAEYERLRRLREKVEAQEMKLRKLRSLRGGGGGTQNGQQQPIGGANSTNRNTVLADLDSIRGLFNEKEKELSKAVRKVEDLTHQLDDLRSGRLNNHYPPQIVELERLRRELAYRKQLSEQQNQMISQQRAQLAVGRDEISRIDSRVMELQERLERKRMMNQQLANQISAATSAKQDQLRAIQQSMMTGTNASKNKNKPVSTVEPFQRQTHGGAVPKGDDLHNSINKNHHQQQQKYLEEKDTKYQTLPFGRYNNNNNSGNKKDLQNARFSEAPAATTDYQGNYSTENNNGMNKPVSTVAPVVNRSNPSRDSSPEMLGNSKPKPALPPKPMTNMDRNGSVSPPPYVPAPPPGGPPIDTSPESVETAITILRGGLMAYNQQSEEGTSVDDEMPSEEDDQPRSNGLTVMPSVHISIDRRIEMPPAFHFPENQPPPSDLLSGHQDIMLRDVTDNPNLYPMMHQIYKEFDHLSPEEKNRVSAAATELVEEELEDEEDQFYFQSGNVPEFESDPESRKEKPPGIIKRPKDPTVEPGPRRGVSFDPLALLLDASLEGELELVKQTARQVSNPSAANDEGITALHNAICAGHFDIVKFLVEFGCDVNAPDSDGWTPLHCAASCNNLPMVRFLVEHGACIFATTLSDHETAAEKCEEDEEGFDGCSEYLYGVQEKLGLVNGGDVYAVYDYEDSREDELSFKVGHRITVVKKGDDNEVEWWWAKDHTGEREGYIPRNLLGLFPRVQPLKNGLSSEERGESDAPKERDEDEDVAMSSN